jgi:CHAD domain-containing protein
MRKEIELKFGMGHWARRSGTDGRQRIERFTADILASRTKRAMKKAKKLRKLDARQRGTVRGRTSLKGLQDHLGALNDIQVHQKLIPRLASGKSRTKRRQRVFAASVASGREQSEIEPLLNSAVKDARKFDQIRPFWT